MLPGRNLHGRTEIDGLAIPPPDSCQSITKPNGQRQRIQGLGNLKNFLEARVDQGCSIAVEKYPRQSASMRESASPLKIVCNSISIPASLARGPFDNPSHRLFHIQIELASLDKHCSYQVGSTSISLRLKQWWGRCLLALLPTFP